MRLTPLDIQNHQFSKRLRGLDPDEVETFLQLIGEDYEDLLREREALRDWMRKLEIRVEELSGNEKALRDTLVTAQSLSEDLKKTAQRESEVIVSEAEVQAEKVLEAAYRRAARLGEDIREMKAFRGRLEAALRATMKTHLALLETLAQPSDAELAEEKVTYLTRPRHAPEG